MLLQKNNLKLLTALFLIFSNYWILKIFTQSLYIGLTLSALTIILTLSFRKNPVLISCMGLLITLQLFTTSPVSLTNLDNDQQRVQQERIRSYPPTYIDLFVKVIWLKPATWIEQNKFVIALSRIEENLFKTLDLNYYFFGGFPRNTPSDFEKFPFMLFPFFIGGVYILVSKKEYASLALLFFAPLALFSLTGSNNPYGAFALFPFFIIASLEGINMLSGLIKKKKLFFVIFILLMLLILIMQISYAKN